MSQSIPTIDFKVTVEEKQFLVAERERKSREEREAKEKEEKEKLRLQRNAEAVVIQSKLIAGRKGIDMVLSTLSDEIKESKREILRGDSLSRRGKDEAGSTVKAKSELSAAINMSLLCEIVETGIRMLCAVNDMGISNVDTYGSSTLMSIYQASSSAGRAIQIILKAMGETLCEFAKETGDRQEEDEGGDGKRKRV